jgi:D-sedoheptulose 7-phosphate isomerase
MPRLTLMLNRKDLPVDLCHDCAVAVLANPHVLSRALGMNPVFVDFALAHNMWSEHNYDGGGYSCQCCATPLGHSPRPGRWEGHKQRGNIRGATMPENEFTDAYLSETIEVVKRLDRAAIEKLAELLAETRARWGRLFILGVGGSAAHASHAANDFRKLAALESYAPSDNVSELTARANDEGWAGIFEGWLKVSRLRAEDCVLVFSVGGGSVEQNVSPNLVAALDYAKRVGASVGGVVGRDGGYTARVADACVIIPTVQPARVTPHTEGLAAVVWHLLVSHPKLKAAGTKWESLK